MLEDIVWQNTTAVESEAKLDELDVELEVARAIELDVEPGELDVELLVLCILCYARRPSALLRSLPDLRLC